MTSAARIEANRRNAARSTGPKTDAGKERVRHNALTHGLAAETVLPSEDALAYEQRRVAWTRELSPGGAVGDYLAERAARLSWQLDRADAAERAELARRVRDLPRERERSRRRRAVEQVRLILAPDAVENRADGKPPRPRADRLERLESTPHGCRALLEAWANIDERLAGPGHSVANAGEHIARLLGCSDVHTAIRSADPRLRSIGALALEAHRRGLQAARLAAIREETGPDLSKPADDAPARLALREVVAIERERLTALLEDHDAEQPDPMADDAARAAFDSSKEAERLHRYQAQWGRALLQTLKAVAALKPAVAEEPATEEAPEQTQRDEDNNEPDKELRPADRPRSRRPAGPRLAPATERLGLIGDREPERRPWEEASADESVALAS